MNPSAPEAEKRPQAKNPPTRTIGGKPMPLDTDQLTTEGRPPRYALCEPYTFGMRLAEPATDGGLHKYRYPVAEAYTDAMQALLTFGIEWPAIPGAKGPFLPAGREGLRAKAKPSGVRMTWPVTGKQTDAFIEAIVPIVEAALQATAFRLPAPAIPAIAFFDDKKQTSAAGTLDYKYWELQINPSLIEEICKSREPSSRDLKLALLAATLYHEARHAQQFFWMLAMVKQFPMDYPGLALLQTVFPEIFKKSLPSIADTAPLPDEPTSRVAIKRMVIGYYYALLVTQIRDLEKQSNAQGQLAEYQRELEICDKQAAELLLRVGRNGRPIDYKQLPSTVGYRIRPWEDDAFACDFVVSQLWLARALPEPDRCNRFYDLRAGEQPDASL